MTGWAGRYIRRATIGCVTLLAIIAGTVSYLHMRCRQQPPELTRQAQRGHDLEKTGGDAA